MPFGTNIKGGPRGIAVSQYGNRSYDMSETVYSFWEHAMLRSRYNKPGIACTFGLLIVIPLFVCQPAFAQPDWVTALGESAQYPPALFLTGFGQSEESQDGADERARGDLSRQIRTTGSRTTT